MNNRCLTRRRSRFFSAAVFVVIVAMSMLGAFPVQSVSAQGTPPTPPAPTNPDLVAQLAQQGVAVSYNAKSKLAHFIGAGSRPIRMSGIFAASAQRSDVAR